MFTTWEQIKSKILESGIEEEKLNGYIEELVKYRRSLEYARIRLFNLGYFVYDSSYLFKKFRKEEFNAQATKALLRHYAHIPRATIPDALVEAAKEYGYKLPQRAKNNRLKWNYDLVEGSKEK